MDILHTFLNKLDLPQNTECFPKQAELTKDQMGNGIMLPHMYGVGNNAIRDFEEGDIEITSDPEKFADWFYSQGVAASEIKIDLPKPEKKKDDYETDNGLSKWEILKGIKNTDTISFTIYNDNEFDIFITSENTDKKATIISKLKLLDMDEKIYLNGLLDVDPANQHWPRHAKEFWTNMTIKVGFEGVELEVGKDDNGKPYLINSKYHISISHKFPYVTSIFDNKACGVDIERIDNKVRKIKSKFLTENEEKKIGDNLKKLVEYWSIKESTYKVEGKTIPLKKINVNQKSKSLYESFANGKNFKLSVLEIDNHILSYTT